MKLEFTIGTETYRVPDYISIETFQKAVVWNIEDLKNLKPFVATIIGCPMYHLDKLDEEVLAFITGTCLSKMNMQQSDLLLTIEDQETYYNLMDFDEMTFGQFIDIDTYISKGAALNLSKIVSVLYGVNERECLQWNVEKVWAALQAVAQWRISIYKEYDEFFELEDNEDVGEVEESEPNIQLMWWESTMALANEDFLKVHQVVERPLREAMNFLTWKKAKVQKEKLEILKRKNAIQRSSR